MAEEEVEGQGTEGKEAPKKDKSKLLIIIIAAAVVLGGGGFAAYQKLFSGGQASHGSAEKSEDKKLDKEAKTVLIAFDPFVVNLSEQGRFLKMTLQFEVTDASYETLVKDKTPLVRDAVITLISSKGADSISSPEGKFQLKDEILMRANASMGRDVFKNVFFTEFVMQ